MKRKNLYATCVCPIIQRLGTIFAESGGKREIEIARTASNGVKGRFPSE